MEEFRGIYRDIEELNTNLNGAVDRLIRGSDNDLTIAIAECEVIVFKLLQVFKLFQDDFVLPKQRIIDVYDWDYNMLKEWYVVENNGLIIDALNTNIFQLCYLVSLIYMNNMIDLIAILESKRSSSGESTSSPE